MELSHVDSSGKAVMVDVSPKPVTRRIARAVGAVAMSPETARLLREGLLKKGDAVACARIAGIMAAKRTAELIPLCHPLPLDNVAVEIDIGAGRVDIRAEALSIGRTGVEMEALTAVSVAALTIYDMCKAVDKGMVVGEIRLVEKRKDPL